VGKYTQNIVSFPLAKDGYQIDVQRTLDLAHTLEPKVMIVGRSLFLFPEPVRELASFCHERHIPLLYDGAHVLGLIGGHEFQDPLEEGALLITASTHKTFFGSQRGLILSNAGEVEWRKIDKGAFPGSSSNHHLDTLVALAIATYEMMEFGQAYARQTIANARALGAKLYEMGFRVQAPELGFTESHQLAIDVSQYGGGDEAARHLKDNNIILNMNLLPFESLDQVTNPAGIRLGVLEMTRFGMKEPEMEIIARLFKECLIDGKYVGEEVTEFRQRFQKVNYSYDHLNPTEVISPTCRNMRLKSTCPLSSHPEGSKSNG
jgi:glycine hydroxymethyltransferase